MKLKKLFSTAALLTFTIVLFGQDAILKTGVFYNPLKKGKAGIATVLKGPTTFFQEFEVIAVRLKSGATYSGKQTDKEEMVIVREGYLSISFNDKLKVIGSGGVAFIIPGDTRSYKNEGKELSTFYLLQFKSRMPIELDRAKTNGGSFVMDWGETIAKTHDKGSRRDFFNRPTASCNKYEMHVTSLNPGQVSHLPHTHAEEEIILLLQGDAVMDIDNQKYPATAGALVFLPSMIPHALQNAGKGPAEYFAFQWKRTE